MLSHFNDPQVGMMRMMMKRQFLIIVTILSIELKNVSVQKRFVMESLTAQIKVMKQTVQHLVNQRILRVMIVTFLEQKT